MPKSNKIRDDQLIKACEFARKQKHPKIAEIARQFEVNYHTLYRRLQKQSYDQPPPPPHNKTLKRYQEDALTHWISNMRDLHIPVTHRMVEEFANRALSRAGSDRRVSKMWPYRFTKSLPPHLQLKPMKQKTKDKKRLNAEDAGLLQFWYNQLNNVVKNLPSRLVYNFDECGFQPGQGRPRKVLGTQGLSPPDLAEAEHSENISAIECIAADGWIMTPLFIFKGERFMESWFDHPDLPNFYTAVSEKGYINDQLAIDWLHKFHEETSIPERLKRDEKRVLIFDGHTAHLTVEFLQLCEDYKILPFCFRPHTTHICQPLDGKPFLTYKTHFRSQNNEISQWGGVPAGKSDFLKDIVAVRMKTFNPRIIRNAFKERGIFPPDGSIQIEAIMRKIPKEPEIFSSNLPAYDKTTPSPPPEITSSSIENTPPKSAEKADKNHQKLLKLLDIYEKTPKLIRHLEKSEYHTKRMIEEFSMASDTIDRIKDIQAPRIRKSTKRQVPNLSDTGILTTRDANRSIEDTRKKKAIQEEKRLKKQWEKIYGKTTPTPASKRSKKKTSKSSNSAHSEGQENELYYIDSVGDRS